MTIQMLRKITEAEFHRYRKIGRKAGPAGWTWTTEERYWYVYGHPDEDVSLLGIVLYDKIDHDWSYVVLGEHVGDTWKPIDVACSFRSAVAAEDAMHTSLEREHLAL